MAEAEAEEVEAAAVRRARVALEVKRANEANARHVAEVKEKAALLADAAAMRGNG